MQQKIERLHLPRHCSPMPVLVHANEVSEDVTHGECFARIIDFTEMLKMNP